MSTDTLERPTTDEEIDTGAADEQAADAAENAEQTAAAANEVPAPTLEELKRTHYQEIAALGARVDSARLAWEGLKGEQADAKKEYEGLNVQLLKLIRRGPERQRELPLTDADAASGSDAPLPVDDSWRKLNVSELGIADYIVGALVNGRIDTLGDLQDYWQAGKQLRELKGIGEASDAAVVEAFSTYGTLHPEVFGSQQPAADEPTDDQEADDDSGDDEPGVDST